MIGISSVSISYQSFSHQHSSGDHRQVELPSIAFLDLPFHVIAVVFSRLPCILRSSSKLDDSMLERIHQVLGSHVIVCTGTRPIGASLPLFKTVRRPSTFDIWHPLSNNMHSRRFSHHPGWDEVMPVSLAVSLECLPRNLVLYDDTGLPREKAITYPCLEDFSPVPVPPSLYWA